jgi:Uma2 family endonuclease
MDRFVLANKLGEVYFAPTDVRLYEGTVRQPDVLFIREENRGRITRQGLDGPPDWVAEVISAGTRETDEVAKLADYARAGVPEYWLVDPADQTIRVYTLHEGAYRLAAAYTPGQTARSETLPGFAVTVDTLFGE